MPAHPLRLLTTLFLLGLMLASSIALAQPGGREFPGNRGNEPGEPGGPPPWAGGPPPWAGGPPATPEPPANPGGGDDDDDDDDGAVPDFCSGGPQPGGPNGQAGMSSIAHLNFSQQDPESGEPIEDGAWARVMYRWIAPMFDFVFNAHELEPGDEFTLTYQPQPLPSSGVICLATGEVNEEGDLHLQDAFELDSDLPAEYDENQDEATLALVSTGDVDCETGEMTAWTPENYLFGDEGMFYVDSDLEDDEG